MKDDKYLLILGFIGLILTVLFAVIGVVIQSSGGDVIISRCFLCVAGVMFGKSIISFVEYRNYIKQNK